MTTSAMRRKAAAKAAAEAMPPVDRGIAIGESDAHVFNCPSCARPLAKGATKCQGCGTRLILGVAFKRAGAILALGVALGVFIGGTVTAVALAIAVRQPEVAAPIATTPEVVPTAGVVATRPPVHPVIPAAPAAPAGAVAALRGTAVLNGRISVDAAALQAALSSRGTRTIDIARAMRALAADAVLGTDLTSRIAPWAEAKDEGARLAAFYDAMTTTARAGLQASLTNGAAYRAAGEEMLTVLGALDEVDGALRALAATIDVDLPPVAVPGGSDVPAGPVASSAP
jgi:hypothetical protein